MEAGNTLVIRKPVRSKMGGKMAALFAISFALFFMVLFVYDLMAGFAERSAAAAVVDSQTTVISIDPKIASDLAKVLALDNAPMIENVKDPFSDRAGLSASVTSSTTSGTSPAIAQASGGGGTQSVPRQNVSVASSAPGNPAVTVSSPVAATKERYETWLARFGYSDAPVDPRLFAIEDLTPVGIVDGGSGQQEVMFISEAAGRTLSFPVGTLFYDGWLTELRPEGVVFSVNDERRTTRMRSWARSVRNSG